MITFKLIQKTDSNYIPGGATNYTFEATPDTCCFSSLKIVITKDTKSIFFDIETKKNNATKVKDLQQKLEHAKLFCQNYVGIISTHSMGPYDIDQNIAQVFKALEETEKEEVDLESLGDLYTQCGFNIPSNFNARIQQQKEQQEKIAKQQAEKSKREAHELIKFKQAEERYKKLKSASNTQQPMMTNSNSNAPNEWQLIKIEDYVPITKTVGVTYIFESKAPTFKSIKINLEADQEKFSVEIGIEPTGVSYSDPAFKTFTDNCWYNIAQAPIYSVLYSNNRHVIHLSNFPLSILKEKLNALLDEVSSLQTISDSSRKLIIDTVTNVMTKANANDEIEVDSQVVCAM